MNAQSGTVIAAIIAMSIGSAFGQESANSRPDIPVLTVCEALNDLHKYNDKAVVLVGKLMGTDEGRWLSEDCQHKIITDGYTWQNIVSLAYSRSHVKSPPTLPESFKWNARLLIAKLKQVQKTTTLEVPKQRNYGDKWFAIFGRFETRLPLQVVQGRGGKQFGYGFGHMNAAPAQLISDDEDRRELKPQ